MKCWKKNCFLEETNREECADVGLVKDMAFHCCCCCCCCRDQDLCYCCYCQLERLSMRGGLLRESCVSAWSPADASVDLCAYCVCVFFSGCACEVAGLISNCCSCTHRMMAGGKDAAIPQLFFSSSYSFYCLSRSFPLCLCLPFLSLCFCFPLIHRPSSNNKVPFWEE